MRIAHLSDLHIRNLKYHYEYKKVLEEICSILFKEKVDIIVFTGDWAHTKVNLSPEYFELSSNYLNELSKIAPLYMILGNHDGNLSNASRQDALSPIVKALSNKKIMLIKNSAEIDISHHEKSVPKKGFTFNVMSIFDKDNWKAPTDFNKINIALYHGAIRGCKTDVGWSMDYGEHDISIFDKFDYAMLGDIHKTNQVLDEKGKIRYAGSMIQQNHGETNDKGFLIWDIKSKEEFNVKHVEIKNPKPFVTVELTKKGKIPNKTVVPKGARVRLISNNHIAFDSIKKAIDVAKKKFEPESVTFLNRATEKGSIGDLVDNLVQENLRDPAVQEELIEKFLKDYEVEKEVLEKVFDLNRKYNAAAAQDDDVLRNVHWQLKKFEWDNLFNYGGNNRIDFSNMRGTVGIFGKNFSGKSSIIDGLLFTNYNSISKKSTKNINVVNQNKDHGRGYVEIIIGNETYFVERIAEKYEKKLHGKVTQEAKTYLNFYKVDNITGEKTDLNGDSRPDTDKRIRKVFGTLDDFLLTSMSSQFGSQIYINEGSTKRKEILAKFLDLEVFDKKHKLAKEDASDLRGALKRLENRNFDVEIEEAEKELEDNKVELGKQKKECITLKNAISVKGKEIALLQDKINSIPTEIIDIHDVKNNIDIVEKEIKNNKDRNQELSGSIKSSRDKKNKIDEFLNSTFDIEHFREQKREIDKISKEVEKIEWECKKEEERIKLHEEKSKRLKEVPCGDKYPSCPFIKHAHEASGIVKEGWSRIEELKSSVISLKKDIEELEPQKIDQYLEQYDKLVEKRTVLSEEINSKELEKEMNKNKIFTNNQKMKDLKNKAKEYEDNREAIENLEQILKEKQDKEVVLDDLNEMLENCEKMVLKLIKSNGSCEQKLEDLIEQKNELFSLREEYEAYDLFLKCMHADGISYDIIKKRLPIINNEIAKVLANVVPFEVFFENDGRKLDIFIKHPKYDARPLEMGSGAEKDISGMAIRLALLSVSSLPKPDLFVLDEPGTSLDEDGLEGFTRIIELVKSYFKVVVLISHMEALKDTVDTQIVIDRKDGYAYVNHKEG